MAVNAAFVPQTKLILLTTNSTINTANSTNITQANLGLPAGNPFPSQGRIVNVGTVAVFVSFTTATATIAAPTAGAGNGQFVLILLPNVIEVFTINSGQALWVNDISGTASQNYYFLLGEGM